MYVTSAYQSSYAIHRKISKAPVRRRRRRYPRSYHGQWGPYVHTSILVARRWGSQSIVCHTIKVRRRVPSACVSLSPHSSNGCRSLRSTASMAATVAVAHPRLGLVRAMRGDA